ncbi:hypothetical protein THER_0344 [Thermodesulfovibrio sp. N1]|nr:hypothetical protein THER_0344 [Thermodesulfovibrio sp. N1]
MVKLPSAKEGPVRLVIIEYLTSIGLDKKSPFPVFFAKNLIFMVF